MPKWRNFTQKEVKQKWTAITDTSIPLEQGTGFGHPFKAGDVVVCRNDSGTGLSSVVRDHIYCVAEISETGLRLLGRGGTYWLASRFEFAEGHHAQVA